MTNFILPYSQRHVLTNSIQDDPFSLFDCLRFFHDKIIKLSISLDTQNAVSFQLFYNSQVELNQNFFFQFPMSLMSAKTIKLYNTETVEIIELSELLAPESEQRFFEFFTKSKKIDGISFHGLYPSKVPSKLSNYDEIDAELTSKNLCQVPPELECKNIEFNHFGNVKNLIQYRYQHDEKTDFQLKSKSSGTTLLIKIHTSKKRISSLDFNHPTDHTFADHFERFFNEYLGKLLSYELYIWNGENNCSISRDPRADAEAKNFLDDIYENVVKFLSSKKIKEMENSIVEKNLMAAVTLLDKRKEAISISRKIETRHGFRFKVPSNEYETVILFSAILAENSHPFYHFELHEYAASQGIDSISTYKVRRTDVAKSTQATEFEHKLSNFFKHGHPIQHTEIIICWVVDPCPYELSKTEFPWLYKLNIDGHSIPVVEIEKFPGLEALS